MSDFFDARNIREVIDGTWVAPPAAGLRVNGVGTDTREPLSGRAFVALRGPRHDGHDHLRAAGMAGSPLLIVERLADGAATDGIAVLQVRDTRRALRDLAAAYRRTFRHTCVIAITGSCGKTTTKELIHAALSVTLRGSRAPKSFNNDIGVPLSILAADAHDDYVVLEIGMNQPGEIAKLAEIARPDVAVITTIGPAHLGGLGTLAAIAEEKASLLDALAADGLAVLNADHEFADAHAARAANVIRFGVADGADLQLTDYGQDDALQLWWFDVNRTTRYRLSIPGRHNAINALAAVAVAQHLGIADEAVSEGMARLALPSMRMDRCEIDGIAFWNDAYNANPQSMRASIEAFLELAAGADRRVLILGDMLELGQHAAAFHESLGGALLELSEMNAVDRVIFIGELMHYAEHVVAQRWGPGRVQSYTDVDQRAIGRIWNELKPGDAVLLKASRGLMLERLITQRPAGRDRVRSAAVA